MNGNTLLLKKIKKNVFSVTVVFFLQVEGWISKLKGGYSALDDKLAML